MDKIPYLNYIYDNIGGTSTSSCDFFKVAIAPQKAAIFEGETFKADMYLAAYSSNPGSGVTFIINNREIPIKEGVARFETKETTIGKKTVKAIARIRNPLTGAIATSVGEFEYEVLPKCAKNCQ